MEQRPPRPSGQTTVGLGVIEGARERERQHAAPIAREEQSTPPEGSDFGSMHAAIAGEEAAGQAAAARVSIEALARRLAEIHGLVRDQGARQAVRLDALESGLARAVARVERSIERGLAELRGQVLAVEVSVIEGRLRQEAETHERARLEGEILSARAGVEAARRDARAALAATDDEETTSPGSRISSTAEATLAEAARIGLEHARQEQERARERERVELERQRADLTVRTEGRRAWIRTVSMVMLAALGAGGWVWIALMRGCGG